MTSLRELAVTTQRALRISFVAALCPLVRLFAQQPPDHQGLQYAIGAGYSRLKADCDCGDVRRSAGNSFVLRLGGAVQRSVVLSAEVIGWNAGHDWGHPRATFYNAVVQLYPVAHRGFFVRGGAGLAQVKVIARSGVVLLHARRVGPGAVAGIGYDMPLRNRLAMTPFVDYLYAQKSRATFLNLDSVSRLGASFVHFGIALSKH